VDSGHRLHLSGDEHLHDHILDSLTHTHTHSTHTHTHTLSHTYTTHIYTTRTHTHTHTHSTHQRAWGSHQLEWQLVHDSWCTKQANSERPHSLTHSHTHSLTRSHGRTHARTHAPKKPCQHHVWLHTSIGDTLSMCNDSDIKSVTCVHFTGSTYQSSNNILS
jgi:hypothetical protein